MVVVYDRRGGGGGGGQDWRVSKRISGVGGSSLSLLFELGMRRKDGGKNPKPERNPVGHGSST